MERRGGSASVASSRRRAYGDDAVRRPTAWTAVDRTASWSESSRPMSGRAAASSRPRSQPGASSSERPSSAGWRGSLGGLAS
eukprot:6442528-Prymnesium_polylepis.1